MLSRALFILPNIHLVVKQSIRNCGSPKPTSRGGLRVYKTVELHACIVGHVLATLIVLHTLHTSLGVDIM